LSKFWFEQVNYTQNLCITLVQDTLEQN